MVIGTVGNTKQWSYDGEVQRRRFVLYDVVVLVDISDHRAFTSFKTGLFNPRPVWKIWSVGSFFLVPKRFVVSGLVV